MTDSEDIVDSEPVGGNEDIQLQALLELVSAGVDYYFSEFSLTTCVHITVWGKIFEGYKFHGFCVFFTHPRNFFHKIASNAVSQWQKTQKSFSSKICSP